MIHILLWFVFYCLPICSCKITALIYSWFALIKSFKYSRMCGPTV